jgi:hypothetical protein
MGVPVNMQRIHGPSRRDPKALHPEVCPGAIAVRAPARAGIPGEDALSPRKGRPCANGGASGVPRQIRDYPSAKLSEQLLRELGLSREHQERRVLRTELYRRSIIPPEGSTAEELGRLLLGVARNSG